MFIISIIIITIITIIIIIIITIIIIIISSIIILIIIIIIIIITMIIISIIIISNIVMFIMFIIVIVSVIVSADPVRFKSPARPRTPQLAVPGGHQSDLKARCVDIMRYLSNTASFVLCVVCVSGIIICYMIHHF